VIRYRSTEACPVSICVRRYVSSPHSFSTYFSKRDWMASIAACDTGRGEWLLSFFSYPMLLLPPYSVHHPVRFASSMRNVLICWYTPATAMNSRGNPCQCDCRMWCRSICTGKTNGLFCAGCIRVWCTGWPSSRPN